MDIALLSMALSQGQVQQQASLSVMKKAMDQVQQGADGLTKMMATADVQALQHSAQPHLGGNIDLKG
ncbi:YjfB family protein [Bacillus sp. JJ1532]|uniref:YjfB family protein n=1 Tax=Bacillus sp. JJ1532 TaxID=3122958 RepID=UPI002FFDFCEB